MSLVAQRRYNSFFTEFIKQELLTEEQAASISEKCQEEEMDFCAYLLKTEIVPTSEIAKILAHTFKYPLFNWDTYDPQTIPRSIIDERSVAQTGVLPLYVKGNDTIVCAISNPQNVQEVEAVGSYTGLKTEIVISDHAKLMDFIGLNFSTYEINGITKEDLIKKMVDDGTVLENRQQKQEVDDPENNTPLINFLNKTLRDAVREKASDLHFEPFEKHYRIRFRVDGVLQEVSSLPPEIAPRITSRLKVWAGLDISEKRLPQDGRIRLAVTDTKYIDFRMNTLPTAHGEKIVLRILDGSLAKLGIEMLGFSALQKDMYLDALAQPQGMILITGSTGSGKTVSLYTGLNHLNKIGVNISTAEDPIEITLDGINQVSVNIKTGLTFATALRAFLRQDPDVIMVGEIRDLETAEIAVKAAQTGHMVMSTLHTNSAAETLSRLRNMGIPSYNLATSVNLVIAQRLVRKLCQKCKVIDENISEHVLQELGFTDAQIETGFTIYKAKTTGCDLCESGYKGRVGIYEVVKITPEIAKIIVEDGNATQINEISQKLGFNNLRQSGLEKVQLGLTSILEVMRVTTNN